MMQVFTANAKTATAKEGLIANVIKSYEWRSGHRPKGPKLASEGQNNKNKIADAVKLRQRIATSISQMGPSTVVEIADALTKSPGLVKSRVSGMMMCGYLVSEMRGKTAAYDLTPRLRKIYKLDYIDTVSEAMGAGITY